jgi:hypothetical protein
MAASTIPQHTMCRHSSLKVLRRSSVRKWSPSFWSGRHIHGRVTFIGGSESTQAVGKSSIQSSRLRNASTGRAALNDKRCPCRYHPSRYPRWLSHQCSDRSYCLTGVVWCVYPSDAKVVAITILRVRLPKRRRTRLPRRRQQCTSDHA